MTEYEETLVLNYLEEHSTMVLSTNGPDGPWATPVFYVNRGFKLYFLSESTTLHIRNLNESDHAAVAVTDNHTEWKEIQGLQIKGRVYRVSKVGEQALVLSAYAKKFPAVRQILEKPELFKGVTAARWHCFQPEFVRFTDNTRAFGEKIEFRVEQ